MNLYINPYKSLTVHFWYVIHKPEKCYCKGQMIWTQTIRNREANKSSLSIHLIDIPKQHLKHLKSNASWNLSVSIMQLESIIRITKITGYQISILHKISPVVTESKALAYKPCVSTTSFFFVLPLLELSQLTW